MARKLARGSKRSRISKMSSTIAESNCAWGRHARTPRSHTDYLRDLRRNIANDRFPSPGS